MSRVDRTLHALIDEAWRQHYRDPAQLLPLGQQIVQVAGADPAGAAWGWLHQAWGQRFRSDGAAAQLALDQAKALFIGAASAAGLASCRDLQAMLLGLARQWEEALALLAQNDAVAAQRSAFERCQTHQRRGWACDALGRRDDALRERYALLAAARETGDEAATAHALGLLGGLHADLYNLEEAEALCAEAALLAERSGALQAWAIATLNRMNALLGLGRGLETLPLAQALMAQEQRLNQRAREQRCIVYADAHTASAHHATAQALLDESRALRHQGSESLLSWTTAQVVAWVAQGEPAQARDLAQSWLDSPAHGTDPGSVPSEQLRLLQALSTACEALGDTAAALRWTRQAFAVHETLVGRSQRARRLALEIEHSLAFERWQRQQAEQEHARLEGLNQALAAANQAKTRFLAAASHDLRQPVQALALNMAALELETVTPVQGQLVRRMGRSLQALSQMFDVLLDISRLDAGIVPVALQPLSLRALLLRLRDDLATTASLRGLTVRLHLPSRSSALMTRSDPVLLERCVRNLLDNAVKYTHQGGVLLALRPHAGGWRLEVWDTGIGMTSDVQAKAFDEFYQADNPERDRTRGLGLGLAIVQRLARLLGHGLALQSRPGRGTRVVLQLPQVDEPVSPADRTPIATDPAEGRLCVAVVDDDAEVRDSLCALLQRWGHGVLAGADDAAVLKAWRAGGCQPVQALITDLRLRGGLDGLQVVASLRQAWRRDLPALVITGDVAPERLQLLRDSGLAWLPKPVMPMRLRGWLNQAANAVD